jgi:hypothetical protein
VIKGNWKSCRICRIKFGSCLTCAAITKYCSKACSKVGRLASKRVSNRKSAKTLLSKLKQSRRQARHRKSLREKKATGHTSPPASEKLRPESKKIVEATKPAGAMAPSGFPRITHCYRCKQGPLWFPAFSEGQHYGDSS